MQIQCTTILLVTTLVASVGACGGGASPLIDPIPDQIAQVGVELAIPITVTDPDGDTLEYDFEGNIPGLRERASITRTPSGSGMFRWTPLASDVGVWAVDFIVDDGSHSERATIRIDVRSAVGKESAPIFRLPLGTGTTLDTTLNSCIDIDIEIEDTDTPQVTLAEEEPRIPGGMLTPVSGLTGKWQWCPTTAQLESGEDRYRLVLSASDQMNPKTVKNYLVVLRQGTKPNCPGQAPMVMHTPRDESTLVGLTISADISDDVGLKNEPLLYYSLQPVSSPPDLNRMTLVTMRLTSGNMVRGTFKADIPNPVASGNMGDSATIHYLIVANDDDDQAGDCDHVTQSPVTGTFQMTVTNPGGAGGAAICQPCTSDIQCGDSDDLCVRVGAEAEPFCLQGCASDTECPTNFVCSPSPVQSTGGRSGRQCVPNSNDCSDPSGTICRDDTLEDNDTQAQAAANPALTPGSHDLVSCPASTGTGDDEDWYRIDVASPARFMATLTGGMATDLDLWLYDSQGFVVARSISYSSNESLDECLGAGTYFLRMNSIGSVKNTYTLVYSQTPGGCAATCQADGAEPDDGPGQARITDIDPAPFVSTGNTICASNDDWYKVLLYTGEQIIVDATFTHAAGDLDVYFHNAAGTNLSPCCSTAGGQSSTDNEHAVYTAPSGCTFSLCTFYVRVHGYSGAENSYDLRIELVP